MSYAQPQMQAFRAAIDMRTFQNCFVKFVTNDETVTPAIVAGELGIGVLLNAPNVGELAEVALFGAGGQVKLSGTVARGVPISATVTTAQGKAAVATETCMGIAMASGVAGDIIPMQLAPFRF